MIFLSLFIVPAIIALILFCVFHHKITLLEFLIQLAAQAIFIFICIFFLYNVNTRDVGIINGWVTEKKQEKVSCSHSYQCNCRPVTYGTGEDAHTTIECDTCYEHSFDYDWNVYTTLGTYEISRVDRQGCEEPPRWTQVQVKDPVSATYSYTNYIKGSPDTLFRNQGLVDKYKNALPEYPNRLYDYYKVDRVLFVDATATPNIKEWNDKLFKVNSLLGQRKQVNIILVFVKNRPQEYFYALEQAWLGGKKNDVVIVMSVDEMYNTQWVNIMAWTDKEFFKVQLRDRLLNIGNITNVDTILEAIQSEVNIGYLRKSMKDFKYLKSTITPTSFQWWIALLLSVLVSFGLSWFFYHFDAANE